MHRALALATLFAGLAGAASSQVLGVLHIKVTLTDAARASVPIARHALLISDNPSTSTPRRVVTTDDGTADVRLRPGNYTVESDEPFNFGGKSYQWTETLDVPAGRDVVLELTAKNAEVGAAVAPASSAARKEDPQALLLPQWKDSIVAIWTPQSRASGFLVSADGLVVTDQRTIGSASAVEVQLTPSVKVAARILVVDRTRDVAVLWIDSAAVAAARPLPLACAEKSPPLADNDRLVTIGAPLRGEKELLPGSVANFRLEPGNFGGPVFSTEGRLVGLSSLADDQDDRRRRDARIVPLDAVCEVVKSVETAKQAAQRPNAARLPVEPPALSAAALEEAVRRHAGSLSPAQMSSSDFDIVFLTPPSIKSAKPTDFGNWSDYFAEIPPVLAIRVTPKLTESFWTTVARGAAYTQGAAIPAIKHFKPGFARLQVWCGDIEVTPIHPFIVERRVSETDAVREGLYVFDPHMLGPQCKSVRLVVASEKDPKKEDTRAVDPRMIERVWQDF